jgi:hypothetical protein
MDIAQPSITKVGGLSEMRKVAVVAASANVTVVPHAFYYGPGAGGERALRGSRRRACRTSSSRASQLEAPGLRSRSCGVAGTSMPTIGRGSAPIPIRAWSSATRIGWEPVAAFDLT